MVVFMPQRYLLRRGRKGDLHEVWGMEILTDSIFFGNPLLEWVKALGYFAGSIIVARVVYALFKGVFKRLVAKTATKWDDVLMDQVEEPVAMGIVILGFWLGYGNLHFGANVDQFMEHVFQILIAIDITWLVARLLDSVVSNLILHLDERTDGGMVSQFGPILQKTLRSLVWILGIISGLTNAGYDVGALLALSLIHI